MESGMTRIERMVELKTTIIYYEIIIKSNLWQKPHSKSIVEFCVLSTTVHNISLKTSKEKHTNLKGIEMYELNYRKYVTPSRRLITRDSTL